MPPAHMSSSLKTVAEAVTGLLTMLLQFMIQHLEAMPEDAETPSEMMGVMTGMVQELQNQRSVRQSLMTTSLRPKTAQRKAPETQLEIQSWPVPQPWSQPLRGLRQEIFQQRAALALQQTPL